MAGQMRITLFFEQGEYGWTEGYFPPATDYPTAVAKANALAPVRAVLLGGGANTPQLMGYRVSDDTVFRDALVQFFQPPLIGGSSPPLHPTTCLLARLTANPLVRRPLYLRGIPSSIMADSGAYIPGPIAGLFNNLRNFLIGPPAWLVKTQINQPAPLPKQVLASVTAPNIFSTAAPHGLASGDVVSILGTSRHRNPTGIWKVAPGVGNTTFDLIGVDLPADYIYTPGSLYVRKNVVSYQAITRVDDERITERAAGRPFGVPRGRRSPHRV